MRRENKVYLGDSVYAVFCATFDGYHVILTTENDLPGDPSNQIALADYVLSALNRYAERCLENPNSGGDCREEKP